MNGQVSQEPRQRRYSWELKERAVRMVLEIPSLGPGACPRSTHLPQGDEECDDPGRVDRVLIC